ncbi:MAG TPA: DoxX family protein [Cyclobacteriaceae bacterium]|nr:DoxX family protein [Cyclobacteriaceae bacterium]
MKATNSNSKGWNISLWVAQVVLALMFLWAALPKVTTPMHELASAIPLANESSAILMRFIGVSELLAVLGLILPGILRIKPMLIAWAALGLVIVMVLAMAYHLNQGEVGPALFNVLLGLLAAFVAWGRYRVAPIEATAETYVHQQAK